MKTVAILTPFRNARRYLPLYFSQMGSLQSLLKTEGLRIRIVAAEGDSLDGTRERLVELAQEHNINLTLVDTTHGLMKWASVEDPVRLKTMSDIMNKALDQVKQSDDIVVWIMSDLEWKAEAILDMIRECQEEKAIIAPSVLLINGQFYDTWAYRNLDGTRFTTENPYRVPKEFAGCCVVFESTEIASAGTCLVMPSIIAQQCRADREEAVSFCDNARTEGYKVFLSVPSNCVFHAPLPSKRLLWISDAVCTSGFARVAHAMFPQLVEAGYDLDIVALNYFGEPHNYPYRIFPASVQGDDLSGNLRAKYLIYQAYKEDRPYDLIIKLDDPWNIKGLTKALEELESEYQVPSPPVLAWITVDGKNINRSELESVHLISCTDFGSLQIRGDISSNVSSILQTFDKPIIDSFGMPIPGVVEVSSRPLSAPVVPFAVDTSIFRPLDKTECRALVSSSEVPADAFIVGVVSTNQLRKRLDLVLQYFSEWINQYNIPNAYLYLCLGPDDKSGFDINSLKDYYGLKNKIIWNPHLLNDQALALVYSSFDVYLSLSQGEGFGLPALEAMACGVPCVLSDWAGYSSWVSEGVAYKITCTSTAVNSPANVQSYVVGGIADKEETIGALQKLYLYPELREKMGKAGVEFAKEMSWKQTGDKLIKEIELVLSRSQKR